MKNISKFVIPGSIILGCIFIGYFIYLSAVEKQSIVNAQEREQYIGKRKLECYDILEKERKQFNNVVDVKYYKPSSNPYDGVDYNDSCRVEYIDKKTEITFFKSY